MIAHDGRCRIDGVALGEVTLNLLGPEPVLTAKYALTNTVSGTRFGAGTRSHWSSDTLQRLTDLVEAMEKDCASDIFEPGDSTTLSGVSPFPSTSEDIPSL